MRIPNFIMLDWGIGTAATATAYAKNHFGDLFIDFKKRFVFGIDGLLMKRFDFVGNQVIIELAIIKGKKNIFIKGKDVSNDFFEIIINGISIGKFGKKVLTRGFKYNIKES
jgi:hypothetical protein